MRRASVLLTCSIALGSAGCAARAEPPAPAPVVEAARRCARPAAPALPQVRGDLLFDDPVQIEALLTRDARLRAYARGLQDALDCYDAQAIMPGGGYD